MKKIYDPIKNTWLTEEQALRAKAKRENKARSDLPFPQIIKPMPEFISMASGKLITTRTEKREDMKRHNCRELDPSEYKPQYRKPKNQKRLLQGKR